MDKIIFLQILKDGVTIAGILVNVKLVKILAYRSDVLVHEYEGDKRQQAYRHSASLQAAEVAKNAEVKRLLLTHISARYLGKTTKVRRRG